MKLSDGVANEELVCVGNMLKKQQLQKRYLAYI